MAALRAAQMTKYARSRYHFARFRLSKCDIGDGKCKMTFQISKKCTFRMSAKMANAPKTHRGPKSRSFFLNGSAAKQHWHFENQPPCLRASVCFFTGRVAAERSSDSADCSLRRATLGASARRTRGSRRRLDGIRQARKSRVDTGERRTTNPRRARSATSAR